MSYEFAEQNSHPWRVANSSANSREFAREFSFLVENSRNTMGNENSHFLSKTEE